MNNTMINLNKEHVALKELLALLEWKLQLLEEDKIVDYHVLEEAIMYIENYVDLYHHPKENIIYQYIIDKKLDKKNSFKQKQHEHDLLKNVTEELKQSLQSITLDIIISKHTFITQLRDFIDGLKVHLDEEDHETFPLITTLLTDDDWDKLATMMPKYNDDPLFGKQQKKEYLQLYKSLKNFNVS